MQQNFISIELFYQSLSQPVYPKDGVLISIQERVRNSCWYFLPKIRESFPSRVVKAASDHRGKIKRFWALKTMIKSNAGHFFSSVFSQLRLQKSGGKDYSLGFQDILYDLAKIYTVLFKLDFLVKNNKNCCKKKVQCAW